jgi:uncharacterized membrane protein YeaQ/YmgE (transglycosylase-associated protein family)
MSLFIFLFVGCLVGLLARALTPGDHPMSLGATMLLGIVGSLAGGGLSALISSRGAELEVHSIPVVFAFFGAVGALALWGADRRRRA